MASFTDIAGRVRSVADRRQSASEAVDSLLEASVEYGGTTGRAIAHTLGRVTSLPISMLVTPQMLYNTPQGQTEKLVKDFEKVRPKHLENVKVRMGGTNTVDDVLWKKEGEGWRQRLGGRAFHNPHQTMLGWATGAPFVPIANVMSDLTRATHYHPVTDTVHVYGSSAPILQHELGHAINLNRLTAEKKTLPRRLARDVLTTLPGFGEGSGLPIPLTRLPLEIMANLESRHVLQKVHGKDSPEYKLAAAERAAVLPAALSTYATAGSPLALPVIAATRLGGLGYRALRRHQVLSQWEREHPGRWVPDSSRTVGKS